jgi:hypothetical protein
VTTVNDNAFRRAQTRPMFFSTPSTKEHTVKRIATTALAALIVTLALASVASAHRSARSHANLKPAAHVSHVGHHRMAY